MQAARAQSNLAPSGGVRDGSRLSRRGLLFGAASSLSLASASVALLPRLVSPAAAAGDSTAPLLPPPPPPPVLHPHATRAEWDVFARRFVTGEGRVVDNGNGGVSHSEGQGWAMLMAATLDDDPARFDLLRDWTRRHLQIRGTDSLHAWRWQPNLPNKVPDLNNATDGDLFIAAALARAATRWERPDWAEAGRRVARDVLGAVVREAGGRALLLPGAVGFDRAEGWVINPSYYAFGLLPDLEALAPSPLWGRLRDDGAALLTQARFGADGLPPDWLLVDRRTLALTPAPGWPPRFSWDALRVPLHAMWGRVPGRPGVAGLARLWRAGAPAWVDLRTGAPAPYPAGPGLRAIAAVAFSESHLDVTEPLPSVMGASDYYSAGLVILARIAATEAQARA